MTSNKIKKKNDVVERGISDEEFLAFLKKCDEEIEERTIFITSPPTYLQKLESQIEEAASVYLNSNKDKKYGIEAAKLLLKLKNLYPQHNYITFFNYILEENYLK